MSEGQVCEIHGSATKTTAGEWLCCTQERWFEKAAPPAPVGSGSCPSELKAQVEADFQKRRAARAREGAQG